MGKVSQEAFFSAEHISSTKYAEKTYFGWNEDTNLWIQVVYWADSPFFGTIFFHEEEINGNKEGKGNLAILYNEEAEREPVIIHKFCLPSVTHFQV